MGHSIGYLTVTKQRDIIPAAVEYAQYNGGELEGSDIYHGNMTILSNIPPFENYDAAVDYIEDRYIGNYHDVAVRFYDCEKKPPTKTMIILKERIDKICEKLSEEENKRNTQAKKLRIEKYNAKKKELITKYKEAESRNVKNNGMFWLVKVEVHC